MSTSSDATIVWGEVLWDRFPDGDQLGGAPANVAWHLGQVGGWPQLVSRVGNDELGHRAIERLATFVDVELVQVDATRATGEVEIVLVDSEPRYRLVPGRAWEAIECTPDVAHAVAQANVLVFGTLAQRDPRGLIEWRAACGAAAKTCVTACDLNLRPGQRIDHAVLEAIAAADILKLNDRELAALRDELDWSDPIAELRERARVVAVTHGAAGATLYGERGDVIEVPGAPAAPGGDNVGCGDAFFAVLIHGLSCGADLTASGRAAARYAAAVAEQRGATPTFEPAHIVRLVAELA